MAIGRDWDEIYKNMDCFTQEDRDEIDFKVKLVGEILDARKGKGMTQSELDALCGVKQTHIARIENNRTDPQLSTILKILRSLGKTLAVVDIPQIATGASENR